MKKLLTFILLALTLMSAGARSRWTFEAEDPSTRLSFKGDTLDIVSPKGVTVWYDQKLEGDVEIEYYARVVCEGGQHDRLSDLNCFWMATDPKAGGDIHKRTKWRSGVFNNCYSMSLYYMGYGGNSNSTTRFRRYDGDYESFSREGKRPAILVEHTDKEHLLKANHWYHIRITTSGMRTRYYIDGELLVDYADPQPLRSGWFGFRSTKSHTQLTGFRVKSADKNAPIALGFIGNAPKRNTPTTWGVPFGRGEVKPNTAFTLNGDGKAVEHDFWPLAYWPDGSVKWGAFAAVIPGSTKSINLTKGGNRRAAGKKNADTKQIIVNTGKTKVFISRSGRNVIDSIVCSGRRIASEGWLSCSDKYVSRVENAVVEREGAVRTCIRIDGRHTDGSRQWMPFTLRLYLYKGSNEMKIVHTFTFDGSQESDRISSIGFHLKVPMNSELYNRHVAFAAEDGGMWSEPVQPLIGRRLPTEAGLQRRQMNGERLPRKSELSQRTQQLIADWASWNDYRLSQLNDGSFTIRKRANSNNPWIGTTTGHRASGYAFVGDCDGGISVAMKDFWQSYPSTITITDACSNEATLTMWLWSPEAEAMDLTHYDNRAHGLDASYEDVQEGMSTPYGIARTSTITLCAEEGYRGKAWASQNAAHMGATAQLTCTPEYLHSKHAFGIWSLPERNTSFQQSVENRLDEFIDYYKKAIEQHHWYGFWNYGDVMHDYDAMRHEWRYDIGGYAWDNTELASNMWLWYSYLRTGREDIWRMAEAMTRHTAEVDVYHTGKNSGLGSRHNVSHWGCGAKEARISQAAWNRFYYYLTADERCGDLMKAVADADTMLYHLDPMRLAQPRSKYPCTAPARLRIGPDWLAYAGNWMTEWERTGNTAYRDKIVAGMKSIAALPHGLFSGPKALGYDPATGIVSCECDTSIQNTNHLMTIMGGFEIMNEMMEMIDLPEWNAAWLDHAANYKRKAAEISGNHFRVSRLGAYAAFRGRNAQKARETWADLMRAPIARGKAVTISKPETIEERTEDLTINTNSVATWALDAIYMLEVLNK
ncbi:MAG: hypothetical protein IKR18_01610 [Bacteroidaceae bacterium]|nr:hypothetical protein [Bacteroidaceae bacterium]